MSNQPGRATFDELDRSFQGSFLARRQQHVKMLGHHDECVQSICSDIAVVEKRFDKDLAGRRDLENWRGFPKFGRLQNMGAGNGTGDGRLSGAGHTI